VTGPPCFTTTMPARQRTLQNGHKPASLRSSQQASRQARLPTASFESFAGQVALDAFLGKPFYILLWRSLGNHGLGACTQQQK
jgi:hypothetical protein